MDYRCPLCRADLGQHKLVQAIVTKMESDCSVCRGRLRMNVHQAEMAVVLVSFGAILVVGVLAWSLRSHALALLLFGVAMAGSLAVPLLESTWLKRWPRYVPAAKPPAAS
jgi:uncharacterized protein (DUF983 family)